MAGWPDVGESVVERHDHGDRFASTGLAS